MVIKQARNCPESYRHSQLFSKFNYVSYTTYILQALFLFIFIIPRKLNKDSLTCKHFYSSLWRPEISYRHAEEQTQYLPVCDRYLPWHTRSLSTVLNFSRRYVCQGIWKRLPRKLNRNVTRELFIEHAFFHATQLTILTLHLESR